MVPARLFENVENDMTKAKASAADAAVKTESRCCFGIRWFASEDDAAAFHKVVRERGLEYNGGFFDGMPCGRDPSFDYEENGKKLYAVTC